VSVLQWLLFGLRGTSLTDGVKVCIGAMNVLLLRDNVLMEIKHPSSPDELMLAQKVDNG
jgi:hypothetical protein